MQLRGHAVTLAPLQLLKVRNFFVYGSKGRDAQAPSVRPTAGELIRKARKEGVARNRVRKAHAIESGLAGTPSREAIALPSEQLLVSHCTAVSARRQRGIRFERSAHLARTRRGRFPAFRILRRATSCEHLGVDF